MKEPSLWSTLLRSLSTGKIFKCGPFKFLKVNQNVIIGKSIVRFLWPRLIWLWVTRIKPKKFDSDKKSIIEIGGIFWPVIKGKIQPAWTQTTGFPFPSPTKEITAATVRRGRKLGISVNGQEPKAWFDDGGIPFFDPAGKNVIHIVTRGKSIGLSLNGHEPNCWLPINYQVTRRLSYQSHAFTGFSLDYIVCY